MTAVDARWLGRSVRAAFPEFRLEALGRTASTQDRVRAAARRGAAEGFCCVAAEQTAGRGRQGRAWVAPAGGALLASVLLRPTAAALPGVPFAAGLAVCAALRGRGVPAAVKWPNDVLVEGAKIAGVLVEGGTGEPSATAIVGVGVNLRIEHFPSGVRATSLHRFVPEVVHPFELLRDVLVQLRRRLEVLEGDGLPALLEEWRGAAAGLGAHIRAETPAGMISGIALDVDGDGALLVDTAGGVLRVIAADVHIGS